MTTADANALFGKYSSRMALFFLKKGKKGIERKDYPSIQSINQKFNEDYAAVRKGDAGIMLELNGTTFYEANPTAQSDIGAWLVVQQTEEPQGDSGGGGSASGV